MWLIGKLFTCEGVFRCEEFHSACSGGDVGFLADDLTPSGTGSGQCNFKENPYRMWSAVPICAASWCGRRWSPGPFRSRVGMRNCAWKTRSGVDWTRLRRSRSGLSPTSAKKSITLDQPRCR
ncbi:hypothetical protein [Azospirillum endophyticum]